MKPTVGRIVHYYGSDDGTPIAAIVTEVSPGGETVGLSCFRGESRWAEADVRHSKLPQARHWTWPPREAT